MENFDNEQWRDIDGYDGMYQVSDLGRVRSRKSGEWKVLKAYMINSGYLMVSLCKGKTQNSYLIHRLVASAFIPNDDETKTQINHINEVKSENMVSNLEWCSAQYNSTYNNIHLRHKAYIHTQPKRDKVKDLYDKNLSIPKNLEIFKANGIECSRRVIIDLRKDLRKDIKLERPRYYPVRDKIKDIYRPDLTEKENIAIFNEQGVECSRSTIYQLRKDLGLTRKYTKRS